MKEKYIYLNDEWEQFVYDRDIKWEKFVISIDNR